MVNMPTPRIISSIDSFLIFPLLLYTEGLQRYAGKRHKAQTNQTRADEGNSKTTKAFWNVRILQLLAYRCQQSDCKRPAHTTANTINDRFTKVVVTLDHEQYTTENCTVHGNQR